MLWLIISDLIIKLPPNQSTTLQLIPVGRLPAKKKGGQAAKRRSPALGFRSLAGFRRRNTAGFNMLTDPHRRTKREQFHEGFWKWEATPFHYHSQKDNHVSICYRRRRITDAVGYKEYKELAAPTVALYGGKYIARGGCAETLEGNWIPNRLVILEFPSMEQAKKWLHSPEYSGPRQLRHKTATTNMVVVEGV